MNEQAVADLDQALSQMNNAILAIAKVVAQLDAASLQQCLGAAVYASRNQGVGDTIILEIFQKALPGFQLPVVVG
ncbi:TPA: hypothetical protein ACRNCK_001694 [Pseudomonas aeruginosa]|uniref:hypothetical protein n=1 Tax=Pseudomonas aeruginosa TaxID=287 RepID=UPI001574915C|nr:hypothetical protein [Pseudomonas aeruginosa]NTT92943.1 hypothetical protein [Pseudomonas aeruginosa]HCF3155539.1 hypothetical protein [Pseudomonas aeruginosa]